MAASPAKMPASLESDLGNDDDRAALVAFGDDLKEQLRTALVQP
jgi:hypothetical protein